MPITQATGAKRVPKILSKLEGNHRKPKCASALWIPPRIPFDNAIRARNEISIAAMFNARFKPSVVPRAMAPSTFSCFSASTSFSFITTRPAVFGCSVSGTSILEIRIVPGAVMITALSRCLGSMPNAMYAAIIPPETCAMPLVITVINSERVRSGRKGRMVSGASVCPMKMLAATLSDSAPLAPIKLVMTRATCLMMNCITP